MVGLRSRPWRAQGYRGGLYTDLPVQCGWDGSRQRDSDRVIFTFFLAGNPGMKLGLGSPQAQAERLSLVMDDVYNNFSGERTGSAERIHWPEEPFALGSYTCYRPGQWTDMAGLQARRVGGIYFAGEHCSREFRGFMNGAAETGRRAALRIVTRCS
jgi:monoamine oxidase